MSQDAPPPAGTREPVEAPPIKAVFHVNKTQGIGIPDSLIPKDADGKPVTPAADPLAERQLETYRRFGVSEDVIKQVAERKPVSETEYRLAQHRLESLKEIPLSFANTWTAGSTSAEP